MFQSVTDIQEHPTYDYYSVSSAAHWGQNWGSSNSIKCRLQTENVTSTRSDKKRFFTSTSSRRLRELLVNKRAGTGQLLHNFRFQGRALPGLDSSKRQVSRSVPR